MTRISLLEFLSAETGGMKYVMRQIWENKVTIDGKVIKSDISVTSGTWVKIADREFLVTI